MRKTSKPPINTPHPASPYLGSGEKHKILPQRLPPGWGGRRPVPPPFSLPPALKTSRPLLAFLKVTLKGEFVCIFYLHFIFLYILWRGQPFLKRDLRLTKRGALKSVCVFFLWFGFPPPSVPKTAKQKKTGKKDFFFLDFTCGVTMSKPLSQRRRKTKQPCTKKKNWKCKKSPIFILSIPVTLFVYVLLAVP